MPRHALTRPPLRPRTAARRDPPDRLAYRAREVAEMLGVNERTVWTWLREGRLTRLKVGGATFVAADQVLDLLGRLVPEPAPPGDPDVDRMARDMLR